MKNTSTNTKTFQVYTDGATSGNGAANAIGGYGWVVIDTENEIVKEGSNKVERATNNICELLGIIKACEHITTEYEDFQAIIFSDSAYCINCYKQKWYVNWQRNGWKNSQKKPVANRELWKLLIPFFEDKRFDFVKVAGHSGDYWNEYVDDLAVAAKGL